MNIQPFGQTDQMTQLSCEYLSVRCIWLNVLVMSRTRFRVNPHSIACLEQEVPWHSGNYRVWIHSESGCTLNYFKLYFVFEFFGVHLLRSFIKRQTSGTSSDNEWQRLVQPVATNDNKWQRMTTRVQRVTTSGSTSDSKWQLVTTSDNEWQLVTTSDHFG